MSYKDVTAGEKVATIMHGRFIKSSKGTLGLEVQFEFEEPSSGTPERLNWVGWLSPAALENSMETLVNVLGFNGNDSIDDNGNLTDARALAYGEQVKLVVDIEEYNGKQRPRIQWVNRLGGSAFQNAPRESIKADLAAIGFKAAFLAAKQATEAESPKKPDAPF